MKKTTIAYLILWLGIVGSLQAGNPSLNRQPSSNNGITIPGHLTDLTATLVVKGKITRANPAFFDMETLMKFKPKSFETTNHWTGEKEKYTGIGFMDFLNFLEPDKSATIIDVIAINDYKASIRIDDLKQFEYLLSYKLNDRLYADHESKKNKGPIAIAINFDKHNNLDREVYKHQLVWFVKTIIVR